MIQKVYNWVETLADVPRVISEAIKLGKVDLREIPGEKDNPHIMALAEEAGVRSIYPHDETAWCAVAMTVLLLRAGRNVPFVGYDRLRAKSFATYCQPIAEPELGDILVFTRDGGGHVGIYLAEDDTTYYVIGGNQSNDFNVTRILKSRLSTARRTPYVNKPKSVKRYFIQTNGTISTNEK